MAHTLADALLATAIVVVWQRLYGAQETGWMAAPLRVMGFVPAVVHMAWAQVLLAQPQHARTNHPLWVGLAGFASVALLGGGCAVALEMGLMGEQWQGAESYLLPLVIWQGSACLVAAVSYRPYEVGAEGKYSFLCISLTIIQNAVLILPLLVLNTQFTSDLHMRLFAVISALGLFFIAYKSNTFRIHT
jgi:hypothetical protein